MSTVTMPISRLMFFFFFKTVFCFKYLSIAYFLLMLEFVNVLGLSCTVLVGTFKGRKSDTWLMC